ncbi:Cell-traversal protein [Babesia duncani]|uniref:Cell-traversal protein n=1 Tax=Babesia duncani TaxID=323732 RepID=A0AAD9PLS7_9APIC|nr:Cell-traversal protein [Babesia duncani]
MKFFSVLFLVGALKSAAGYRARHKIMDEPKAPAAVAAPEFKGLFTRATKQIVEFKDKLQKDLSGKVEEVVELIAADIEKILKSSGAIKPSFIQTDMHAKVKKVIKETVFAILRHTLPEFEKWIAKAIRPPSSSPVVYSAVVRPVASSIFREVDGRLNIPFDPQVWENESDEGMALDDDDFGDASSIEA